LAEITDSKTRQQNQQAHLEYLKRLEDEAQQAEQQRQQVEQQQHHSQMRNETIDALNELQTTKYNEMVEPETGNTVDRDARETRMKNVREKLAPVQTWGGIAGMPVIAKDSFAPMFSGTKYAQNAREYLFNRRISRTQSSARVDKDEATRLVGRLDPDEVKGKSKAELTQLARDKYFARSSSPLSEAEALRFTDMEIAKMAKSGGLQHAQQKFLGMKPTQTPNADLNALVKQKALDNFHSRQDGVRGSLGKILYGDAGERQSVLKKLPIDLSSDTVTGRAVGALGHAGLVGASALPALSVGLGSAAQYNSLQKLRKDRAFTGGVGKVAEGATTASGLIRAGIFGPAATLMAANAFGGSGGLISNAGQGAYRAAKDSAFGLTSMLGGGALKMASGAANVLGGKGVDLGGSLAGAAKGVGFGASMAGLTPALVGGLVLALPGIIGGITTHMAAKKKRIARGFKQSTDKLTKQFSRSLGIDSVIRNLFSSSAITSDRMLELQMLMYIEQNTASLPKMVADTGLMSDRKEKDGTKTIDTHGRHLRESVESAYESGRAGSKFKRRIKYAWERGLADVQRFSHAINIPGQIADFLINRKTPFARKEEFRRAREDAKFQLLNPANLKKASGILNTSAGHVQLMGMSAARLIQSSGAQSVESQQLALQAGIFDLLRLQFRMVARNTLRKSGTGVGLTPRVAEDDVTGFRRFMHRIPILSSLLSVYETGAKGFKIAKSIPGRIQNTISDIKDARRGTLQLGQEKSGIGRFLSKRIVGNEQIERMDAIAKIKEKMGLSKTNADKIETFQLKLPEYWEELLHLSRQTVESLHNIFNVGNKALSYSGAGEITYASRGSEQKVFDYASGESLTQSHYNRLIADRRDTFDKELNVEKPKLTTRLFRKMFGGQHSQTAQSPARQKSLQQFSTDDDFKLKNVSGIATPSPISLPTPTSGESSCVDDCRNNSECCEESKNVLSNGFSSVNLMINKLFDCCKTNNECIDTNSNVLQSSIKDIKKIKVRATSSGPCDDDDCDDDCNDDHKTVSSDGFQNVDSIIKNLFEQAKDNTNLNASASNIPDFNNVRSATTELEEAEIKEKETQERLFKRTVVNGMRSIVEEIKNLKGGISKKDSTKESGEGFFSKLSGLISGAFSKIALLFAPLIAALTPLIAPLAAIAAGLGALVGLNKFGKNTSFKEAGIDTVQDLGLANPYAIKNANKSIKWNPFSNKPQTGGPGVVTETFGKIKTGASSLFNSGVDKLKGLGGGITSGINAVTDLGSSIGGKIGSSVETGMGLIKNAGSSEFGKSIISGAKSVGNAISKTPVIGSVARGIGAVSNVASKVAAPLTALDAGYRLYGDIQDPSRLNKRYEDFKDEWSNSGVLGKTWAAAKNILNPYEGGSIIGTGLNKGINNITEFMTGEKGATLGGKVYDWMHSDEKKAQEALLKQKLEENKKKQDERLAATSTPPITQNSVAPLSTPLLLSKPTSASSQVINVKTESLETKTDEQTNVLKTGLDAIVKGSDDLLAFFKGVETSAKESGPVFNDERKQWIKDQVNRVSDNTTAMVTNLTGKAKAIYPQKEPANFGESKTLAKWNEHESVINQKIKEASTITLRKEDELPTVKETHRQEQQVRIPTHSSAPSAMNTGMSGSKSQEVKDRPINPMIDGFIDQLFTNTINVFQQSIKSFAIGQTPFQILR